MVYLTRVEHFNAAHKLARAEWSPEKNYEVFGKCSNPNWHGHNYELHVTVKGVPGAETGYIFNAKTLSAIIKEKVIDLVDHKNLNLDVSFMQGKMPSAENLAIAIWEQIAQDIIDHGAQLHCVKLLETQNIYVCYYGEAS